MVDFNNSLGAIGALFGSGLGNLFGDWKNPADAAMGPLNQIPGMISPYYNPFIQRGNEAGTTLQGQYGNLLNDPGGFLNKMGQSYQQSPGFDFALKQALQGADHAAAAGGMAGTPQHQYDTMKTATGLANQDYNSWLSNALGLYGKGLGGEENMYGTGYNASNELAQSLANNMLSKSKLQYEGQNAENQHEGGVWGSILGGLGGLLGLL